MRILADENLPEPMVERLAHEGHDVERVRERGPGTPDRDVLSMAVSERRLLITRDLDFGELVVCDGLPTAGVVVLRYRREEAREMIEALLHLIATHGDHLTTRFVVLRPDRARLHALPPIRGRSR